jgi:hypothetical protein
MRRRVTRRVIRGDKYHCAPNADGLCVELWEDAAQPIKWSRRQEPAKMKAMTQPQRLTVERLLSKGWIEPLVYRDCVYLFLPGGSGGRKGCVVRDWSRRPIRVTPAGSIFPAQVGDAENAATD